MSKSRSILKDRNKNPDDRDEIYSRGDLSAIKMSEISTEIPQIIAPDFYSLSVFSNILNRSEEFSNVDYALQRFMGMMALCCQNRVVKSDSMKWELIPGQQVWVKGRKITYTIQKSLEEGAPRPVFMWISRDAPTRIKIHAPHCRFELVVDKDEKEFKPRYTSNAPDIGGYRRRLFEQFCIQYFGFDYEGNKALESWGFEDDEESILSYIRKTPENKRSFRFIQRLLEETKPDTPLGDYVRDLYAEEGVSNEQASYFYDRLRVSQHLKALTKGFMLCKEVLGFPLQVHIDDRPNGMRWELEWEGMDLKLLVHGPDMPYVHGENEIYLIHRDVHVGTAYINDRTFRGCRGKVFVYEDPEIPSSTLKRYADMLHEFISDFFEVTQIDIKIKEKKNYPNASKEGTI